MVTPALHTIADPLRRAGPISGGKSRKRDNDLVDETLVRPRYSRGYAIRLESEMPALRSLIEIGPEMTPDSVPSAVRNPAKIRREIRRFMVSSATRKFAWKWLEITLHSVAPALR